MTHQEGGGYSVGNELEEDWIIALVRVVTDSTASIPIALVKKHGIFIVPVDLVFENRVYRDGIDIKASEFYDLLTTAKKLPTSSAPSPGAYLEAFRELSNEASGILCVAISSKLSASFNSACQAQDIARKELPHLHIEVLDSYSAGAAQGWVALAAARAAAGGGSLEEILQVARDMIPRVQMILAFDTLYYLAKGGRVPKAAAWFASILRIKPILHLTNGEMGLLERARTKNKAVERLLAIMKDCLGEGRIHVNIMHGNVPEEAEMLKEKIFAQFQCDEVYVTDFTPVMGAHAGPGVLGLAFYKGE